MAYETISRYNKILKKKQIDMYICRYFIKSCILLTENLSMNSK